MTRSSPTEDSSKVSKRKGTRSVSTLTPSQLARKRANDREAQRAIRARTKEHIERLERELNDYRAHSCHTTMRALMQRNRELELQVAELKRMQSVTAGEAFPGDATLPLGSGPEPQLRGLTLGDPAYSVDNMMTAHASSGGSSRTSSFGQGSPEYNPTTVPTVNTNATSGGPGFGASYLPTPEPSEPWTASVIGPGPVSTVSSPGSTASHPEDYTTSLCYIPTSVPHSMIRAVVPSGPSMTCVDDIKAEFDELDTSSSPNQGYNQARMVHTPAAYLQQQPVWTVYDTPSYYAQPSAL